MFQVVSNIYNRTVITSLTVEEFIENIKNPDFVRKSQVDLARSYYNKSELKKDEPVYKNIKNSLPCITFLNTFSEYVSTENIVDSTGFMYLDIDNVPFIDLKRFPFVVAYWKSLSNNGYGILIKYKKDSNLNLLDCVKELSSLFNLELDVNAVSVDRLNVLSYDKNIYFNPNYEEYIFSTNSKVVSVSYNNTTVYRLEATDTANVDRKIRFSNLDEIVKSFDFNGEAFIDLGDDKIEYAEVFVPKEVFKGNRNKAMFVLCSQLRGLNTWLSFDLLYSICNDLNISKFKPFLSDAELLTIVRKVYNNKKPMVVLNKTKRILFNPDYEISGTEKRKMSAIAIRVAQGKKNTNKLFETINNWDFEKNGVISQSKLAKETGFGIATVKRRAKQFKTIIEEINKDYVNSK